MLTELELTATVYKPFVDFSEPSDGFKFRGTMENLTKLY